MGTAWRWPSAFQSGPSCVLAGSGPRSAVSSELCDPRDPALLSQHLRPSASTSLNSASQGPLSPHLGVSLVRRPHTGMLTEQSAAQPARRSLGCRAMQSAEERGSALSLVTRKETRYFRRALFTSHAILPGSSTSSAGSSYPPGKLPKPEDSLWLQWMPQETRLRASGNVPWPHGLQDKEAATVCQT